MISMCFRCTLGRCRSEDSSLEDWVFPGTSRNPRISRQSQARPWRRSFTSKNRINTNYRSQSCAKARAYSAHSLREITEQAAAFTASLELHKNTSTAQISSARRTATHRSKLQQAWLPQRPPPPCSACASIRTLSRSAASRPRPSQPQCRRNACR